MDELKDVEMVDPSFVVQIVEKVGTSDMVDLMKSIGKWENRIFRVIQHGASCCAMSWEVSQTLFPLRQRS